MEYNPVYREDELQNAMHATKSALLYFSSPGCNVCNILRPKLAELMKTEFPDFQLFYVDIEQSPALAGQLRIFTIPAILVYFEGKEFLRKSRNIGLQELAREIERPYRILYNEN